jgi:DNA-binding XRE family transcriptional regulator
VNETTIYNWEGNRSSPQIHHLPRVIQFLGYDPLPAAQSRGEKLIAVRKKLGLAQKAMARKLGIDPTTLARWEKGRGRQSEESIRLLTHFCGLTNLDIVDAWPNHNCPDEVSLTVGQLKK